MALIPASKHFHLVLSPITVFLKSPELGNLPNLDFEKEQVGLETVKDLGSKIGARRVHLRRVRPLPGELPGVGRRQGAEPEDDHPADAGGAARRASASGSSARSTREKVLWQCTTCGACENQCPVGIEHLPILIGSRRGLVSNGDAPDYLGAMYNNLERRSNIWGLGYDQRTKFVAVGRRSRPSIRRSTTCSSGSAAPARSTPTSRSRCGRCSRSCARESVTFGVLSKERCNGDPAKRTGNEYMFQELANGNIEDLKAAGPKKILDLVPALREDDRRRLPQVRLRGRDRPLVGVRRGAARATLRVERRRRQPSVTTVTFHDPVLSRTLRRQGRRAARAARRASAPTSRSRSATATTRTAAAPAAACCSPTRKRSRASRISDVRFKQLQATGANTVVTACPFCSIMLKGAQASAQARHAVRRPDDVRERQD